MHPLSIKILDGSATEQERVRFNQWLLQEGKEKEFKALQRIWEEAGEKPKADPETDLAWLKFQKTHFSRPTRSTKTRFRWVAIAASMLLLLGLGVLSTAHSTYRLKKGQAERIALNDGSTVSIIGPGTLRVPLYFNWFQREISFQGKAYFTVTKNLSKPFLIESGDVATQVVGTAFLLNTEKKLLEVSEGKVIFSAKKDKVTLIKGEKGWLNGTQLIKSKIKNPNYNAWQSGIFVFENTPVNDVLQSLQGHYLFNLQENAELVNCSFTGSFDQAPLETVLEELSLVNGFAYTFKNNTLSIIHTSCSKK